MKRTLLTALSVAMLISSARAQTANPNPNAGVQSRHGLHINTTGLKPKPSTTTKTSTGTGTTTTPHGGLPTGNSGTTTTTGSSSSTTSKGSKMGEGSGSSSTTGSTSTSTGSTSTTTGGKGSNMGGGSTTTTPGSTGGGGVVTSGDAASAVRQLLIAGVNAAVSKVSATDGYFGNAEIKIPLPDQLQQVGSLLTTYGAGYLVDKLVLQLNRSAEQSATLATPIFVNSLSQITPNDAVNIITGAQQDAATQFLKRTTTEQLVSAFKPQVKTVLDQTKTSDAYSAVMNLYNKIPFVSPQSADLPDYVTRKALDGLFIMVSKEEARIRQNPAAAGSSILSKVLGAIGGNGLAAKKTR